MIVAEDPEARSPLMTSLLVSLALGLSLASVVSAQVVVRAVDFADSPGPYTPAMLRGAAVMLAAAGRSGGVTTAIT